MAGRADRAHPAHRGGQAHQGVALRGVGRYAESDANFQRVIGIYDRLYGSEHVQVGKTRYQLAVTSMEQERWGDARSEMESAFVIVLAEYGDDHGWTRRVAAAMVEICEAQGRPDEAEPYRLLTAED